MTIQMTQSPLRTISSLGVSVAALICSGCSSFPLVAGAGADQLTAALTEFHEGVRGEVLLDLRTMERFRAVEEGHAPEVSYRGRHPEDWIEAVLSRGLADRLCDEDGDCEASNEVSVVSLSRPYDGGSGVLVDAQLKRVTDTGYGLIRSTELIRLQIDKDDSGWRVVASTPVWETSG